MYNFFKYGCPKISLTGLLRNERGIILRFFFKGQIMLNRKTLF